MPRVTLATRIYAPEPAAASFRLRALALALAGRGAAVTVLTSSGPRGTEDEVRDEGVRVRRAPVLRDRSGYVRGYLQYLSFDVPLLLRLLFSRRPDVVVAEPPPTTGLVVRLVCTLKRVPYVYYAADVWSDASASAAPRAVVRLLRAVESWVLRGAARVVAVTPGVADRVHELGASDVRLVRNGIDTAVFRPEGPVHPDAPQGPYAVYAGTMSEWQGADVFVRAMPAVLEKVPDATLVYLGQGSAAEEIAAAARSLPDGGRCVHVLPPVPAAEAAAWLRGARAALVSLKPGQGYDFALPTKVLAGIASGAPVLYAGPGAARDMIGADGLGRVADWDPASVGSELAMMIATEVDGSERRRLGAWADEHASLRARSGDVARIVLELLPERLR
jgi:glycosyltransferase involved in cell wall biosynthesis